MGCAAAGHAADATCNVDRPYSPREIAASTFFTAREQTKFAPSERHYPLAEGANARYCFSRGCVGQLNVTWTEEEQYELLQLRAAMVDDNAPASELAFIKVAVLQMETWLYKRLSALDARAVDRLMQRTAASFGRTNSESLTWLPHAMESYGRFDKECATFTMEATQHLLVLANLGLLRHWQVLPPVYRFGFPGHWTAGLKNLQTCEAFRFDLNYRAEARHRLHVRGENPAALAHQDPRRYGNLLPTMDRLRRGD